MGEVDLAAGMLAHTADNANKGNIVLTDSILLESWERIALWTTSYTSTYIFKIEQMPYVEPVRWSLFRNRPLFETNER
jgi:hypothetical protein